MSSGGDDSLHMHSGYRDVIWEVMAIVPIVVKHHRERAISEGG